MHSNTSKGSDQAKQDDESLKQETSDYDQTALRAGAVQNSAKRKKSAAAFRTISEVAEDLGVKQHVLRFWETKFSQVKPLKRGGGRRYYRPEDIDLLKAIHRLLYIEGYTIKGVQKLLREAGKKQIVTVFSVDDDQVVESEIRPGARPLTGGERSTTMPQKANSLTQKQRDALEVVLEELKELRGMIKPQN